MSRSRSRTGDMALRRVPDGTNNDDMPLFIDQDDWAPIHESVDSARYDTVELSTGNLQNGMIELFCTGELTGFTIICGSDVYQVHAVLLVGQSTFFRGAALGGFEEGIAKTVRLTPMDDEHPYPEFDDPGTLKIFNHSAARHPPPGKSTCFRTPRSSPSQSSMTCLRFENGALRKFKKAVEYRIFDYGIEEVIAEVYTSTPEDARELRDIVTVQLLRHRELLHRDAVRATIENIDGLAYDLLKEMSDVLDESGYDY